MPEIVRRRVAWPIEGYPPRGRHHALDFGDPVHGLEDVGLPLDILPFGRDPVASQATKALARRCAQMKHWAALGAPSNNQLIVFNGERATAVLTDCGHETGIVRPGDSIVDRVVGGRMEVEHRRRL